MTTCCADQIVDLTADDDRLFERLDPACRRAVRKATKAGLTFEIATDPAALAKYMALACRSAVRTGEAPPSTDYYRTILDTFNRDGRAAIGFALSNGTPVAAIFAIADKGAVNFLAGVSEPQGTFYALQRFCPLATHAVGQAPGFRGLSARAVVSQRFRAPGPYRAFRCSKPNSGEGRRR